MKTVIWLTFIFSAITAGAESEMVELFEFNLPIVSQFNYSHLGPYDTCTVKSFTYEGIRYYQTYLKGTNLLPVIASGNINRGPYSQNSFSYSDTLPDSMDGQIVKIKYETIYTLDPKTSEVTRAQLRATTESGVTIHDYI